MATLVGNAIRIKQTFDDIHDDIVEQGVTPTGGIDTYADAIDEIPIYIDPNRTYYSFAASCGAYSNNTSTTAADLTGGSVVSTYFSVSSNNQRTCKKDGLYLFYLENGTHTYGVSSSLDITLRLYIDNRVYYTAVLSGETGNHIDYVLVPLTIGQNFKATYQSNRSLSPCNISASVRAYYVRIV